MLRSSEFQLVYKCGNRINAEFTTVFLMPNELGRHRLGITASRKGIGKAFARNRAKRLLREAFRLSKAELGALGQSYDWVFNARRRLLEVKMEAPLHDLRRIIAEVRKSELGGDNWRNKRVG